MIRLVRPIFVLAALCMALFAGVARAGKRAIKETADGDGGCDRELERRWQPVGGDGGGLAGG